MKQSFLVFLVVILFPIYATSAVTETVTVTDMYDDDAMRLFSSQDGNIITVNETYGDDNLEIVPYQTNNGNGWALVNPNGTYFDKTVTYDSIEIGKSFMFKFNIENKSGRTITDYHFEFLTPQYERLTLGVTGGSPNFDKSNISVGSSTAINIIDFWTESGGTSADSFFDVFYEIEIPDQPFLIIRQVATTTPVPGALLLMASGLLGLAGIKRKK